MNNKKTIIASLILNIVIAASTIFAAIVLFGGFDFMPEDPLVATTKLGQFKFFTTDSNILFGIVALILAIYELLVLVGKKKEIPKALQILKLAATAAVSLTLLVVFSYLTIIVNGKVWLLLKNSSVFFHLINPLLGIIVFVFFENANKLKFRHTLWGAVPTVAYGFFYVTNVLTHAEGGMVSTDYDFYRFVQGGVWQTAIVVPLLLAVSFGISVALWAANKARFKNKI